jgi:hypothetical protein
MAARDFTEINYSKQFKRTWHCFALFSTCAQWKVAEIRNDNCERMIVKVFREHQLQRVHVVDEFVHFQFLTILFSLVRYREFLVCLCCLLVILREQTKDHWRHKKVLPLQKCVRFLNFRMFLLLLQITSTLSVLKPRENCGDLLLITLDFAYSPTILSLALPCSYLIKCVLISLGTGP